MITYKYLWEPVNFSICWAQLTNETNHIEPYRHPRDYCQTFGFEICIKPSRTTHVSPQPQNFLKSQNHSFQLLGNFLSHVIVPTCWLFEWNRTNHENTTNFGIFVISLICFTAPSIVTQGPGTLDYYFPIFYDTSSRFTGKLWRVTDPKKFLILSFFILWFFSVLGTSMEPLTKRTRHHFNFFTRQGINQLKSLRSFCG